LIVWNIIWLKELKQPWLVFVVFVVFVSCCVICRTLLPVHNFFLLFDAVCNTVTSWKELVVLASLRWINFVSKWVVCCSTQRKFSRLAMDPLHLRMN